jgi:rhamnulokinase
MTDVVAVDLGNESGRVYNIRFDGKHIQSSEIYRFANHPVTVQGTLYWDVLRLWHEIQTGLGQALAVPVSGIGVDSFGVDFGLLDGRGRLISNPVHMRDRRTEGMMERVFDSIPRERLFERTGIGFYVINTLYQLMAVADQNRWQLDVAHALLTMPNLITYWLTGERISEFTHTTTTQCYNPTLGDWDREMLDLLGLPTDILPPVIQPGVKVGMHEDVAVYTVASHDTGSAVVAVPTATADFAYISSGTWSLFGVETEQPIITLEAMNANLTNEGGAFGTFRPLKMVMGMWLIQQCRATWAEEGLDTEYGALMAQAENSPAFRAFIDPDDPSFFGPGDMPGRIAAFCHRTGQEAPEGVGAIIRCVLESLALKYRYVLEQLIAVTGRTVSVLHIVGGGAQNPLLCQMTADAIARPVLSGPVEATALGNGIAQLIAMGQVRDLAEGREIIRASYPPTVYDPNYLQDWDGAYARFQEIMAT